MLAQLKIAEIYLLKNNGFNPRTSKLNIFTMCVM